MSPLNLHAFTLRKALWVLGIASIGVFVVTYIGYQSRSLIQGPSIILFDTDGPVRNEQLIVIEGATENIVEITANGKEIHTDEHGAFAHQMILENGYTVTTFTAKDRFGRTTTVEREYVYIPADE